MSFLPLLFVPIINGFSNLIRNGMRNRPFLRMSHIEIPKRKKGHIRALHELAQDARETQRPVPRTDDMRDMIERIRR